MVENIVKEENRSILKLGKNIKDEITQNYELNTVEIIINNENIKDLENIFMHIHPDYKLGRNS
jgi:tRNA nucleotidyltransferase (CCA-adding enzyme)